MDAKNDLLEKYKSLVEERINLEIKFYQTRYPTENFPIPEIVTSDRFHQEVISIYKEYGYPDLYLEDLEKRLNWDSTIALTIFKQMKIPPKIIINELRWRDDTTLHELTHVSDYYNYCRRHNYLDYTFLEFLKLNDFTCVYLFSEFRAFYRCAMYSKEDLAVRLSLQTDQFAKCQEKAFQAKQLEAFYYHAVRYAGFYCSYLIKCSTEEANKFMQQPDVNSIHMFIKFLYPLKDKSFEELESYFPAFQEVLKKFANL